MYDRKTVLAHLMVSQHARAMLDPRKPAIKMQTGKCAGSLQGTVADQRDLVGLSACRNAAAFAFAALFTQSVSDVLIVASH